MTELRAWRKQAGLTQNQLAEKLRVDGQFISNMERGIAPVPTSRFKQLSRVLKVDIAKFLSLHLKREEMIVRKRLGI